MRSIKFIYSCVPNTKIKCITKALENKMNCELMLTYDTPALRQTGSRNLMDPKTRYGVPI